MHAVRNLEFRVARSEIVGLLGPNGAGKTTTQRMLATLLKPSSGNARVAGCDLRTDPVGVRRRIGYVAQKSSTSATAIPVDELIFQARLHGASKAEAQRRTSQLSAALELEGFLHRPCGTLSGGQRRRLDIALGLVHFPELIFLDEPTTGLDPQSRYRLWEYIRRLREYGATVLLTTHYLEEADALCDRIVIMDGGLIVAEGTSESLKRSCSGDTVTLLVNDVERAVCLLDESHEGYSTSRIEGGLRIATSHGKAEALELVRTLETGGVSVSALSITQPSLDDVFFSLTGRSLRESNQGLNS